MSERSLARIKALRALPALAIACHAEAMERAVVAIAERLAGESIRASQANSSLSECERDCQQIVREVIAYRAKIHEGL